MEGAHEHNGWLALVGGGLSIGCVKFDEIVTANIRTEVHKIVIAKMSDKRLKRLRIEQFLADGFSVCGHDALLVPIDE